MTPTTPRLASDTLCLGEHAFRQHLLALAGRAGGQAALARGLGISPGFLNDVIRGRKLPGDAMLEALGARASTVYYVPSAPARVADKGKP